MGLERCSCSVAVWWGGTGLSRAGLVQGGRGVPLRHLSDGGPRELVLGTPTAAAGSAEAEASEPRRDELRGGGIAPAEPSLDRLPDVVRADGQMVGGAQAVEDLGEQGFRLGARARSVL